MLLKENERSVLVDVIYLMFVTLFISFCSKKSLSKNKDVVEVI
jgi:hypothetical protein